MGENRLALKAKATRKGWDDSMKRGAVAGLVSAGWSVRKAARHLGMSPTTAKKWVERATEGLPAADAPRSGRPFAVTPELGQRITELAAMPGYARGAPTFRKALEDEGWEGVPCLQSIRGHLKREGWVYRSPQPRLDLTDENIGKRLAWARANLRKPWSKVAWSDSKIFSDAPTQGKLIPKRYMQKGKTVTARVNKWPKLTAHAYAALTRKGSTELIFCTGTKMAGKKSPFKGTYRPDKKSHARGVDNTEYCNILHKLIPQINTLMSNDFIFMQDGAPCHGQNGRKKAALQNVLNVLNDYQVDLLPWTGQMPDMNPIEKAWSATQTVIWNMELEQPSDDLDTFLEVCQIAWKQVTGTREQCSKFTQNYKARVEKLIELEGHQVE